MWMGKDMMLPFSAVVLLCIYFYLLKLGDIRTLYSSANGLWWQQRYRAIAETILNIILNIILGKFYGIYGMTLATIISLFLCNHIWGVFIIFSNYFGITKIKDYYIYQVKQSTLSMVIGLLTYVVCSLTIISNSLLNLFVRSIICLVIPNISFYLVYRNSEHYRYAKKMITKN